MVCEVCRKKAQMAFKNTIHVREYQPMELTLCYIHDIELFKCGQVKFMNRYEAIFQQKKVSELEFLVGRQD